MLRLLLFLLLTCCCLAEEVPVLLKGQFHGKVGEKTFEQPFEVRLEAGERNDLSVELEDVDLNLSISPKWHYSSGDNSPDGILVNLAVKCRASKLRLQRTASVLLAPGKKGTVEMHQPDADNLFTVEVEAEPAPKD